MTPQQHDELTIAYAMLLGIEFEVTRYQMWQARVPGIGLTGYYSERYQAAIRALSWLGYTVDRKGELRY